MTRTSARLTTQDGPIGCNELYTYPTINQTLEHEHGTGLIIIIVGMFVLVLFFNSVAHSDWNPRLAVIFATTIFTGVFDKTRDGSNHYYNSRNVCFIKLSLVRIRKNKIKLDRTDNDPQDVLFSG